MLGEQKINASSFSRESRETMEDTISLKEIFDLLRKRITTILLSTFIGLALAGGFTFFFVTPQ